MESFNKNPRFVGLKFPDISKPETLEKKYSGNEHAAKNKQNETEAAKPQPLGDATNRISMGI